MHQSGQITIIPKHELKRFGEGISLTFHIISGDQPAGKGRFNFCRINTKNNKIYIPREATTLHFLGLVIFHHNVAGSKKPTCFVSRLFGVHMTTYQKLHFVSIVGSTSWAYLWRRLWNEGLVLGGWNPSNVEGQRGVLMIRRWMAEIPNNHLGWIKPCETNGTNYLHLNWCKHFWTINNIEKDAL